MTETPEAPGPEPTARKGICPNDGKPFDIPPHVRGYKRFCSDKCRSEWHSRLRKKALEMMRAGAGGENDKE